jgi:putative Holliday junction resolvase
VKDLDEIMNELPGRILGIDPGEKRIGLAISDPTQTIASAVGVINHQSRQEDAKQIYNLAVEKDVVLIVLGYADDWDGKPTHQGNKTLRLRDEILALGNIQVHLWSEYGSTKKAQSARRLLNTSRKNRAGHLDDLAAVVILQSYLDSQQDGEDYVQS